jgi:hypothetical protein
MQREKEREKERKMVTLWGDCTFCVQNVGERRLFVDAGSQSHNLSI